TRGRTSVAIPHVRTHSHFPSITCQTVRKCRATRWRACTTHLSDLLSRGQRLRRRELLAPRRPNACSGAYRNAPGRRPQPRSRANAHLSERVTLPSRTPSDSLPVITVV